jgi:hypothetical protein
MRGSTGTHVPNCFQHLVTVLGREREAPGGVPAGPPELRVWHGTRVRRGVGAARARKLCALVVVLVICPRAHHHNTV